MQDQRKTKAQLILELQQARNLLEESASKAGMSSNSELASTAQQSQLAIVNERMALAADSAGFGTWDVYVPEQRLVWDRNMFKIFGIDPKDFDETYETWTKCIHPDDKDMIASEVRRYMQGDAVEKLQYRIVRPNGEIRYIESTRTLVRDENDKVIRMTGISSDVTERKLGIETLKNKQILLDRLVDQSPFATWISDENGLMIRCNPALLKFLNLTQEQLIGKYNVHDDPAINKDGIREKINAVFEQGESVSFSLKWSGEDMPHLNIEGATTVDIEATMFPILDSDGKLTNVVLNWIDVTERKKSEIELQETKAILQAAMDQSTAGIAIADAPDGKLRYVNQAGLGIRGKEQNEIVDNVGISEYVASWQILHFDGTPFEADEVPLVRALLYGETCSEQFIIRRDGDEDRYVSAHATPIRNKDGKVTSAIVVFPDITKQKRAEDEKNDLERQVQHAQKLESLGVLAGGIAHDFNNLLMTILGNADLAIYELSPMSPANANLKEIEKAAVRAAELAKQMLAYSGKGKFVVQTINGAELVEEISHLLEVSISKKVVLKYNFDENAPTFEGDVTQIRQIIMNLITNASEAIGDKSGVIALSTGALDCDRDYLDEIGDVLLTSQEGPLPEGIYSYFEVADTGCGMDSDTIEKIFDPFFTTKFAGRGLGMSAVLGIIRGHKGALKIYSELGRGTTFRVLFPSNGLQDTECYDQEETGLETKLHATGKILIVDDEETICAVGKQMVEKIGFDVITAPDGREAMEIFREKFKDIECVILDLTMPHMDGEETFRKMRRVQPDVKVILCSGYNEQDATQRFIGKGLAGFVQKPFRMVTLRQKLAEVLQDE